MVDTTNGDVNQEYDVYVHEHTPKIFILAIVYLFADKIRPVGEIFHRPFSVSGQKLRYDHTYSNI